jgi:hypothetical protein
LPCAEGPGTATRNCSEPPTEGFYHRRCERPASALEWSGFPTDVVPLMLRNDNKS